MEKVKGRSIMLSVEKYSNVSDDNKEAVVTTPFQKNKSSTNNADKGTEELEDIKYAVIKIRRKNSDKLEGQSKEFTGWFNPDSGFKIYIYN